MERVDGIEAEDFERSLQYAVAARLRAFSGVMEQDHVIERARTIARNYMRAAVAPTMLCAKDPPRIVVLFEVKSQKLGVWIRSGSVQQENPAGVVYFCIEKARRLQVCNRCMRAGEVLVRGGNGKCMVCPVCKGAGVVLPRDQYR